jgi:hypothetical protein
MRDLRILAGLVILMSCSPAEQRSRIAGPATTTTPDSTAVEQILNQAEQEKAAAMTSGLKDFIVWFDRWMADDFAITGADGRVNAGSKAEALKGLAASNWTYESVSVDNLSVHVFGETAVVTATQTERNHKDGKELGGRFQFTHVYVNRDGRWRIVAGHAMRIQ